MEEIKDNKEFKQQKISEVLEAKTKEGKPYFSFEYFPAKTSDGVLNLYSRIERMALWGPQFIDVTWGAGGSTSEKTIGICSTVAKHLGINVQMHLTCTNMPVEQFKNALEACKSAGIRNIMALRGDPPRGKDWEKVEGGFSYAIDLVKYIRKQYGDYFSIGVAGYPEGHPDGKSYEDDLDHLAEKVNAGADVIITQLFYDVDLFLKFVTDCRNKGIKCPILPGLMPIHTYGGFNRMISFCKTKVPEHIKQALEPIKNDDKKVKAYGVQLAIEMSEKLIKGGIFGLHFYTLNLETSCRKILQGLKLLTNPAPSLQKIMPWKNAPGRNQEQIRPVFWSNRPSAYIHRTQSWDDFPNGRWGDTRSAAYGSLSDFHIAHVATPEKMRQEMWGAQIESETDVIKTFVRYINGEITETPWCSGTLQPETEEIKEKLLKLNENGYLTINSQPPVNGLSSSHPIHGWGNEGGYVYQKAYLEFFVSPERWSELKKKLEKFPFLTYHAINLKGESVCSSKSVNTLTWGVFPEKEIIQPTIVDPETFANVWKDEAFQLWKDQWENIYNDEKSKSVLNNIYNTYFLVNIVDNDYINGNIFEVFELK
eukprot:TRINITY_DN3202_c0_g1_i1.p1 TRINITY_DN3202_c0_g1~~TRINITY_DN3202_c0_g1_i1.p1  ORF type:complete len:594 (-),score=196.68 TRINITY_DN3202_c0_g1_i1:158-1939(-)